MNPSDPTPITRRAALRRLMGGALGLALASTGAGAWLSSCQSQAERTMRRQKAEADALLLTGCDACGRCLPCPYGVAIPSVMQCYDRAVGEGRLPDPARQAERLLRHDCQTYSRDLGRIARLAQADRCIGCHKCADRCPRGIDIEATLRRIEAIEAVVREAVL